MATFSKTVKLTVETEREVTESIAAAILEDFIDSLRTNADRVSHPNHVVSAYQAGRVIIRVEAP